MKLKKIAALLAVAGISTPAFATNGMNMEGYGAVATAMGGASMAYENGPGAMMNNPATLGLMPQGRGIGFAIGQLGPDVNSSIPGANAPSGGDSYLMPAFGYVQKTGKWAFGVGIYAQGGMGTEYSAGSFLAQGTGKETRSEVGVGRVIFPLAYNATDALTIGGSIDWVWATMDIKMAAGGADFNAMAIPASMTGAMPAAMAALVGFGADTYRIDFSDNNDFGGSAYGSGFAGKLGFVYKVSPALSVGGTYHTKTSLGDMETGSSAAAFSAYDVGGGAGLLGAVPGKITIRNFQWPETYGLGIAYQPNDQWLIAADYKRVNWSGVMKDFNMTYSSGDVMGMGAGSASFKISQNWKDQNIFMIGASYKYSDALTLRFGGNFANNPVPDDRVHPLFPATVEDHYTFGFGYLFSKQSGIDFSLTYAPEVTVTGTQATGAAGTGIGGNNGIRISHSQLSWVLQYGYRF